VKIVERIYGLFNGKTKLDKVEHWAGKAGSEFASLLFARFMAPQSAPNVHNKVLRMSSAGHPCLRKLWFKHRPWTDHEELAPVTQIKFMYGDLIEVLVIFLMRIAGIKVDDQQRRVDYDLPNGWKVKGSLDLSVGGKVIDVKSVAPFSMKKFESGDFGDDPFGYVSQLSLYRDAGKYTEGAWLAVDKVSGALVECPLKSAPTREDDLVHITDAIESPIPVVRGANATVVKEGPNCKLCTMCSYCEYKDVCYEDANGGKGLRKFIYSKGPVWLTDVKKLPRVAEVKT